MTYVYVQEIPNIHNNKHICINRWYITAGDNKRKGERTKIARDASGKVDEKCVSIIVLVVAFLLHHLTGFVSTSGYIFTDLIVSNSPVMVLTLAIGYTLCILTLAAVITVNRRICGNKVVGLIELFQLNL